jgi:hypothetical protein
MNFDAFWQTHRRFILGYGGAIIAFFILLAVLTSGARGERDTAERAQRKARRDLQEQRYSRAQVNDLEDRIEEFELRNTALAAHALPPFRVQFQIPPGSPPSQHYIQTTGALRQDLVAWALRNDCDVDESLGLPPVSPTQAQQIERVLRGLDVVDRIVRLAVENGAAKVDKINIAMRNQSGRGRNQPVLDITPVSLEVVFERRSAMPFLRAVLEQEEAGMPTGLMSMEVQELKPRRGERRVILEFGAAAKK